MGEGKYSGRQRLMSLASPTRNSKCSRARSGNPSVDRRLKAELMSSRGRRAEPRVSSKRGRGLTTVVDRPRAASLDAEQLRRIGCLDFEAELARHLKHGGVLTEHITIERADAAAIGAGD